MHAQTASHYAGLTKAYISTVCIIKVEDADGPYSYNNMCEVEY